MYLGLDLSTQKLKAIILDENLLLVKILDTCIDVKSVINQNVGEVSCNPMIWINAFKDLLAKISQEIDTTKIISICGCAQQHGSVYWQKNWLTGEYQLEKITDATFTVKSPIWMDSSTTKECLFIQECISKYMKSESDYYIKSVTGSSLQERFTLPQILKIYEYKPTKFENSEKISLISNFLASLFILPKYAPIDYSDGSGMNLMNIFTKKYDDVIYSSLYKYQINVSTIVDKLTLNIVGQERNLNQNIFVPPMIHLDFISPYFVGRYNFNPECNIYAFTGDNIASFIGCHTQPTDLVISLGTSDTLFCWSDEFLTKHFLQSSDLTDKTQGGNSAHIFVNPLSPFQDYMLILVYKNGSLAREKVIMENLEYMNKPNSKTDVLKVLNNALNSAPGNNGHLGFYYVYPEITPHITDKHFPLIYRYHQNSEIRISPNSKQEKSIKFLFGNSGPFPNHFDSECRALLESRFYAMKNHLDFICSKCNKENDCQNYSSFRRRYTRVILTGGASSNKNISQIVANIFGIPVYALNLGDEKVMSESAALGAAYMAKLGNEIQKYITEHEIKDICRVPYLKLFQDMTKHLSPLSLITKPEKEFVDYYDSISLIYKDLEINILKTINK